MHICIYLCMYVCMYVCMYIYGTSRRTQIHLREPLRTLQHVPSGAHMARKIDLLIHKRDQLIRIRT